MLQSSRITPNTLALSFQTPPAIALFFTDNKHKKRRVRRFQIPLTGDNADDIYKSLSSSFPQYLGPSVVPVAQLTRLIQKLLNRFSVDDNSDGDNVSSVEQTSLYSAPEPLSPSPIPILSNPNLNASSSLPPISTPSSFSSSLPPLITKPSATIAPKLDSDSHQGSEAPEANDDELMALLSDLESRTAVPTRSRNKPGKPPAPAAAPASALSSLPVPAAATPSPAPAPSPVKDKSDEPAPKQSTLDTPQPALSSLPQPNRLSGSTLAPLSSLPPLGGRPKLGALPPLGGGLGLSKPNELPKPAAVPAPTMSTEVFIPVSNPDAEDDLNRVSPRALAAKKAEMEKAFKANQVTKASSEFVYDKRADFGPAKEKSEWDDEAEDVEPVSVPVAALSVPVVPTAKPSAVKVEEPVDLDISEDLDIEVEEENEDEEQPQSIPLDKKDAVESSAQKSSSSVLSSLLGAPLAEGLKVVRSSDDGFSNDSDENAENDILF